MVNNNLYKERSNQKGNTTSKIYSFFSIPMSENPDDGNNLPFLFKDPSDDGSVVLTNSLFVIFSFDTQLNYLDIVEKLQEQERIIISPPPQIQII